MKIGIIGGSGLYQIEGFEKQKWRKVATPFGKPSDDYLTGVLAGREVVFLPRHGRGHRILPSELNHRANIYGMKKLGVEWIISVSAVGSLHEKYKPCDIVLVDQFFDRTKKSSEHTFFGNGIVAHIAFAEPLCVSLRKILNDCAKEVMSAQVPKYPSTQVPKNTGTQAPGHSGTPQVHFGGTYCNMEGPTFSTRAESNAHRQLGFDVIGMTNLGEARCAREAEIHYATMAMITDYDCWKTDEAHVTVEMVIANLMKNADAAKKIVKLAIPRIPATTTCGCDSALKNAIMTDKKLWPAATKKRLAAVVQKYK
jgi:5'-methylthioadenosine phosphorylase